MLERIIELCQTLRFQGTTERELQEALERMFQAAFSTAVREAELTPTDKIDFLVGSIGVEAKIDGTTTTVMRQLQRYAASDRIEALVLVTTRAKHRTIPRELRGKPVRVVWLAPF